MNYQGDITLGDTIDLKFTTVTAVGVPTTISGSPVVSAYVDDSAAQITAGITLMVNFDGVTGLHNVRIVASSGNGFATGTDIYLVITTGIVDSVSVAGYVVGSFSIQNRYAASNAQQSTLLAVKAKTDNLPTDPAAVSDIAAVTSALATLTAYVDTEVAAILAKVDPLPADPADASDIAASFAVVNTRLDTIDDFVDTEVGAIKVVTDKLDTTLELDGAFYRFTANALEEAPTGGGEVSPPTGDPESACFENPARTTGPTTEPPAFAQALKKVRIKV